MEASAYRHQVWHDDTLIRVCAPRRVQHHGSAATSSRPTSPSRIDTPSRHQPYYPPNPFAISDAPLAISSTLITFAICARDSET